MIYAVPNLSPNGGAGGGGECAVASFHSLAQHNRNLMAASPAPSCSAGANKGYPRQHNTSARSGGGGGGFGAAPLPSPKPSPSNLYQIPMQNVIQPPPHQIQGVPYVHGSSGVVQRHLAEHPDFSHHQQPYFSTATYLAKLQQLTNELNPFQSHYAMALPGAMSPAPIDMTLPSHASPQRNMTPPDMPAQRHGGKHQGLHRGSGGHQKGGSSSSSAGILPPDIQSSSDMLARYQVLNVGGYHVQQPMTCPSFIHQGSPMQVGVMNVGMHPGQAANFMPAVQGQPNSPMYAAYGYINGGLAAHQPFNMNLNDLMRR